MIYFTQLRLKEWGRFNRESMGGYPSRCPYLSVSIKSHDPMVIPEDINRIDVIIAKLQTKHRLMLINYYCRPGSKREKALAMGISDRTYRRYLEDSERAVHQALDFVPQNGKNQSILRIRVESP